VQREALNAGRRRWYAECSDYERAAEARRYWADPEASRAADRAQYRARNQREDAA
jgi:hypothetical protein